MKAFSPIIERELRSLVKGECFFDDATRERYSTAVCWYKIPPLCVVYPRDAADIQAVMAYCNTNGIAVIARGAATGMAGQALGFGIVLDLTQHMNQVVSVHEHRTVIQPGVVLGRLNDSLRLRNLFFPIDPASSNLCTIGGMIATNAAGSHGLKYGATKDHIEEMTIVLSNGEIARISGNSQGLSSPFYAEITKNLDPILQAQKETIRQRFPNVAKNSSGYNLKDAVKENPTDFRKIIVGSEGTLALVVEATLKLETRPLHKAGALAYFADYEKTVEAVLLGLEIDPAAIEILDHTYVSLVKGISPEIDALILDGAKAMLYFEFEGGIPETVQKSIMQLNRTLSLCKPLKFLPLTTGQEMDNLWKLREEASRIINYEKSTGKSSFIEDVTVPVQHLPEYFKGLRDILAKFGIDFSAYGHAGVGNIHCATFIDLKRLDHYKAVDPIASEVADLVISLGGTLSGEHGDGFIRTPFLERLYGSEVFSLFQQVKHAFDPQNILNPGKIVGPQHTSILHDLNLF